MFKQEKLILWLTFNLGLALPGFGTTRLSSIKKKPGASQRNPPIRIQSKHKTDSKRGKTNQWAEGARKPLTGNKHCKKAKTETEGNRGKYRLLNGKCACTVFTPELLTYPKTNE